MTTPSNRESDIFGARPEDQSRSTAPGGIGGTSTRESRAPIKVGVEPTKYVNAAQLLALAMCNVIAMSRLDRNIKIFRVTDPSDAASCDMLIGVGRELKPSRYIVDHHSDEAAKFFPKSSQQRPPYGLCGLMWHYYASDIIEATCPINPRRLSRATYDMIVNYVSDKVDELVMCKIDIGDAVRDDIDLIGYDISDPEQTTLQARMMREYVRSMEFIVSLDHFTHHINYEQCILGYCPSWWPSRDIIKSPEEHRNEGLGRGAQMFTMFLQNIIIKSFNHETTEWAEKALRDAYKTRPHKNVIFIDDFLCTGTRWEHILLDELKDNDVCFVVMKTNETTFYEICAVPENSNCEKARYLLPLAWRGTYAERLKTISNNPGARFVNGEGTHAGADTKDAALKLAIEAVSLPISISRPDLNRIGRTELSVVSTPTQDNNTPPAGNPVADQDVVAGATS